MKWVDLDTESHYVTGSGEIILTIFYKNQIYTFFPVQPIMKERKYISLEQAKDAAVLNLNQWLR